MFPPLARDSDQFEELKLLNEEPPAVPSNIALFKEDIKPDVEVSQYISICESTGSVSYTAKYCKPGGVSVSFVVSI